MWCCAYRVAGEAESAVVGVVVCTVREGDCLELFKDIADDSVDLILTDPPYNIAQYSTGNIAFNWRSPINNDIAPWDETPLTPQDFVPDFMRILKPQGNIFIFTSYNMIGRWHAAFDPQYDTFQFMAWHKTNPVPNFMQTSFLNSVELIACCWNKGHTWNFSNQKDMHNFMESPVCSGGERLKSPKHPAQKPVSILERIIRIASQEGDTVLDPFMGVGSVGVAAHNLGRNFIGFEIEHDYFEAACRRLGHRCAGLRKECGGKCCEARAA